MFDPENKLGFPVISVTAKLTPRIVTSDDKTDGFVDVEIFGGKIIYGPMPPEWLGPFIDEHREYLSDMCGRYRWSFMDDQNRSQRARPETKVSRFSTLPNR